MASTIPLPTEDDEQRAVVDWLEVHRICFFAVPNGGYRRHIEAAIMQGLGVRKGVPDLIIAEAPPIGGYHAAAIEMKRQRGGVVSPEQRVWLEKLRQRGWAVAVCEGADEAIAQLEAWGYGRRKGVG